MTLSTRLTCVAVMILVAFSLMGPGVSLASEDDPCLGIFMGAQLSAGFLDISLTTGSLKLLNGQENPKLKRLLEWRLATAINRARELIGHRPVMEPVSLPTMVPNWKSATDRARVYIVDHDLDKSSTLKAVDSGLKPLEDLKVIESWLATQPDGSRDQN